MPSPDYQTRHSAPMILAPNKCGAPGYAFTIMLGWSIGLLHRSEPSPAPLLVLVAIAVVAQRYRHTGMRGLSVLIRLLAKEVAVIVFGHRAEPQRVLPAFYLMPPTISPAWFTRRDFCIAMALCAAGPITAPLIAPEPASTIRHGWPGLVLYLSICVAAAAVTHHYLLRTMARHFAAERSLIDRTDTDHPTGMFARQRFFELSSFAVERAQHRAGPLYALCLDVGHFKSINDTQGYAAGDEAFVALSDMLAGVLHPADSFGRLGGGGFAVLLPGCGLAGALAVVERPEIAVAGTQTPAGPLTVSVEVTPPHPGQDLTRLLADADFGLMEAKRQGCNRVCVLIDAQPPANLRQ